MATPLQDPARYLRRLGCDSPPPPTLETLHMLQQRHTAAFAFETVDTLLRLPVAIDLPSLERKLLYDGRGGYCFELNRLFLALLQTLGFKARALMGRVVMGLDEDALTPLTHMIVGVTLDGDDYLADVGFGGMVPTAPLRLTSGAVQATPHEDYRIVERDGRLVLSARVADAWRALYVFDLQSHAPIDLEVANWYVATHPDSSFLGRLRVARTGPGLRKALNGSRFSVHRTGAASEHRDLGDVAAVLAVLRDEFGLRVAETPGLHAAIAACLSAQSPVPAV